MTDQADTEPPPPPDLMTRDELTLELDRMRLAVTQRLEDIDAKLGELVNADKVRRERVVAMLTGALSGVREGLTGDD